MLKHDKPSLTMALPHNVANNASKISHPPHPYYPLEVEITGYLANDMSVPAILGIFFAGCGVIFSITYALVKRIHPRISGNDMITIMWFVLSKYQ